MRCIISDIGENDGFFQFKDSLIGKIVEFVEKTEMQTTAQDYISAIVTPLQGDKDFEKITSHKDVLFFQVILDAPLDVFGIINGEGSRVDKQGLP